MNPIRLEAAPERVAGVAIVRLSAEASAQLPSRGQVAADAVVNGEPRQLVVEPDGRGRPVLLVDPRGVRARVKQAAAQVEIARPGRVMAPCSPSPNSPVRAVNDVGRPAKVGLL